MSRPSLRWIAALALVLGSALAGPSCVLDWKPADRVTTGGGGTTGTNPDCPQCVACSDACSCTPGPGGGCSDACTTSGCTMDCTPGILFCELYCPNGGCTVNCNGATSCIAHCPALDCTLNCQGTLACQMQAQ